MKDTSSGKVVLGVLIPTRNREEFLVHAVKSVQRFSERCSFPVRLTIANNGDSGFLPETVHALAGENIYVLDRPQNVLSMSKNWQRGFDHLKSTDITHLTVLGDDDFLIPPSRTFRRAFLAGFDAVICDRVARQYTWKSNRSPSRISYAKSRNTKQANILRSNPEMMFSDPVLYSLAPSPYQGFVRMGALQAVVDQYGSLSPAKSPDVFLSYALSCFKDLKWISLKKPFIVNGTSPKSNGASTLGVSQNEEPAKEFHLLSKTEIKLPSSLPNLETFPSIFVPMIEVYDWARSVQPEMKNLNIEIVLRGMARSAHLAKHEDVKALLALAKANGVDLSPSVHQAPVEDSPAFNLFYCGFSIEVPEMTPSQACLVLESRLSILRLLIKNGALLVGSLVQNTPRIARWVYRRCRM